MRYFKFIKEDIRWYIVLPEWTGDKSDLEMVYGADTMLEIVAQGDWEVELAISETEIENPRFVLYFNKEEADGAWYNLKSDLFEFEVWLCSVTKFVFGDFPKVLWCK